MDYDYFKFWNIYSFNTNSYKKQSMKKKITLVPDDVKVIIVEKWKQKRIDSIMEISKEVDVKPAKVKAVINEYLSNESLKR